MLQAVGKDSVEEGATLEEVLARIKHKIVIMSGKGGVGKSTVATGLALTLAGEGHKVGVLDVDIHGPDVAKLLGVEDEHILSDGGELQPVAINENLSAMSMAFLLESTDSPVIWRGPIKAATIRQFLGNVAWGELDYLVIDLPPGTGDEPLSVAQLIPEDAWAVIVTTPQDLALLDSRKAIRFAEKLDMEVAGVIENMSGLTCPHCGQQIDLFKTGGGKRAAEELGVPFLGCIPIDPEVVSAGDAGIAYVVNEPDKPAPEALRRISQHLARRLQEEDVDA
jgi:Mrp family chromosome partitioning ATPase